MHLVEPPAREFRWEAIHATLVLALLIHGVGLLAALWTQREGEEPDLRVVARVELVDSLPEPTRPEPLRIPAPPPPPPRVAAAPPAAPAPAAAPALPAVTAPPALPAVTAPPALPGASAPSAPPALPRAGAPAAPRPPAPRPSAPHPTAAAESPAAPAPAAAPRPVAAVPAAPSPAPAAAGPKWAWFPGPDQPRPVSSGRVDPANLAGLGPGRVWIEMRVPANGGRATAPTDVVVREVEGAAPERLTAVALQMARTSLWKPGTRDGAPADHTIRLFLELP